jgi:hypothetical protein
VGRRAVFFYVLPNTRFETVGPGAVRTVVVGLLVTLPTDETAVTGCDDRTRTVLRETTVHVAGREGLGVNRLDPERVACPPDMITAGPSVLVISAGTAPFSHINTVLRAAVTRKHGDNRRGLVVSYWGAVRVEDLRDPLQRATGPGFNIATLNFLVVVVVHGLASSEATRRGCCEHPGISE